MNQLDLFIYIAISMLCTIPLWVISAELLDRHPEMAYTLCVVVAVVPIATFFHLLIAYGAAQ